MADSSVLIFDVQSSAYKKLRLKDNGDDTYNLGTSGTVTVTVAGTGATIAVTGAAALTASSDTAYTFASKANHILVQNNSTTACGLEWDAAATAGSAQVPPGGALFFFDIPVTVVHFYGTAATAVNGTAALNIVLRGWA